MKNKKGFSYVELLIVIGVMAIILGITGLSLGIVSRTTVSRAADTAESCLNKARNNAYTKGTSSGVVYFVSYKGNIYVAYEEPVDGSGNIDPKKLDKKIASNCKISLYGPSEDQAMTASYTRPFMFKQSTGSLMNAYGNKVENTDIKIYFIKGKYNSGFVIDHVTGKTTRL